MRENCLQCLHPKKQKQCLKVERCSTMKRKYKMEYQVKEVKVSTKLYLIDHCQK